MDYKEVVDKLIGPINPIGETNTDEIRFNNLKNMCGLIDALMSSVRSVENNNIDRFEYSRKRAGEYAKSFLIGVRTE